jgi:hypothetical protein
MSVGKIPPPPDGSTAEQVTKRLATSVEPVRYAASGLNDPMAKTMKKEDADELGE